MKTKKRAPYGPVKAARQTAAAVAASASKLPVGLNYSAAVGILQSRLGVYDDIISRNERHLAEAKSILETNTAERDGIIAVLDLLKSQSAQ